MQPHRGVVVLVLGILGLVICFPCGIAAWIMGSSGLKQAAAGTMHPSGRGTNRTGKMFARHVDSAPAFLGSRARRRDVALGAGLGFLGSAGR